MSMRFLPLGFLFFFGELYGCVPCLRVADRRRFGLFQSYKRDANEAVFVSHLNGIPDVEAKCLRPFPLHLDLPRFDIPAAEVMTFALPCAYKILHFHFLCPHMIPPFLLVQAY